jgi:hypothetical protein
MKTTDIDNRPYSKVNKSMRAKVIIIFAYFWFNVFWIVANSFFDCLNNTKRNCTKTEEKMTATFAPVDLLTFE